MGNKYSFGTVLQKEKFTRSNNKKFTFAYRNTVIVCFFNFKQLCGTDIYVISHLPQLSSLPQHRLRSSILDHCNQKLQRTGTLQRKIHNSLLGREISQGIRPSFPLWEFSCDKWSSHTGMFLSAPGCNVVPAQRRWRRALAMPVASPLECADRMGSSVSQEKYST